MGPVTRAGVTLDIHLTEEQVRRTMATDVRLGLGSRPRFLPPKYFYDAAGSALFQRITQLPEYYCTRVEGSILASMAEGLMDDLRPREIVELGAGAPTKVSMLLGTASGRRDVSRYVPVDVDGASIVRMAEDLIRQSPGLRVHGVVGDFEEHLGLLPPRFGRRLVVFFGSTIGNLYPRERRALLAEVRRVLEPEDRFLLGVDLVKDPRLLERAYNDASGVTAAFNRNILRVVNSALRADFAPQAYRHWAFYNRRAERIEMHLVPDAPQAVRVRDLGMRVLILPGEGIWTESSHKFTRQSVAAMLREAGLRLESWHIDGQALFALALAAPDGP